MSIPVFRPATAEDRELLDELIFRAWRWDQPWDAAAFGAHREAAGHDSYVTGFGTRSGDLGVVAELGGRAVGAAWCRTLAGADARAGYLADDVPELAMAVVDDQRGRGLGRRLLTELIAAARAVGHRAVSLHVDDGNTRARALYAAAGFAPVVRRQHGDVLSLEL